MIKKIKHRLHQKYRKKRIDIGKQMVLNQQKLKQGHLFFCARQNTVIYDRKL